MNVLAHLNLRTIFVTLCVFGVLLLPSLALAQTGEDMVEDFAQEMLWAIVNTVFGFFVWAGGMILNYAVTNFVVGFGSIYIDGGLGYSVNLLWGMVRDVFNLMFIFGLVFIGFKLILNSGDSSARRMLGSLILAALLVNFSLFFTKIVIDFTNIAATQFANGFLDGTAYDVSGTFMSLFGLGSIWSTSLSLPDLVAGQGWIYIFMSMILFLIAAFVFFAGGILLSIRFVVLNIYMILSPVMFLGWVFPGFSGTSKEYWRGFLQRAFFAPAYMLMIYLANQVLVNYKTTLPPGRISDMYTSNPAAASQSFDTTIPFFLVAAIFLIASLVVAQKMGAEGTKSVFAMSKRTAKFGGAVAAHYTRKKVDQYASSDATKNGFRANVARSAARGINFVGGRDYLENAAKPYSSWGDAAKKRKAAQAARDSAARQKETVEAGVNAQAELDVLNSMTGPLSPAQTARKVVLEDTIEKMAQTVSSMSTKLLEDMTDAQLTAISKHLTNSQTENLMKSDNLTDAQKGLINTARQKSINEFLTRAGTIQTEQITKLTLEQIETMDEAWIDSNVQHFSKSQMDDLKKSKKFTEVRRDKFADKRKSDHAATLATGRPNTIATLFETAPAVGTTPARRKKPIEIANLGAGILLNPSSIGFLEPADLEAIASKETLTQPERATLRGMIDTPSYRGANKGRLLAYFGSSHGGRHW